ncbi:PBP1A family penicillin-binding protein [Candidatus Parcubacteria bacterium]|nr:PBP1A family penicillin-binding protein [Candidatus Parcubacteria bacterium]
MTWFKSKDLRKQIILVVLIAFMFISGLVALWVATLRIPDLQSFEDKILSGSTKIYDRTGEVLLYDLNQDVKQQVVPFEKISPNIKEATIAIEDEQFYAHKGIQFNSIIRAVLVNLKSLEFSQGGSTITQQVIKNALLTTDKKISRKIKEWVLALKLERVMAKDEILNLYLNGTSYGGTYYGVEEASQNFFGKSSEEVTLAEAAYLAAIPQAPSRYSPFGNNKPLLEARKNLVLDRMLKNNFITKEEYTAAKAEKVSFLPQQRNNIKAPHFVMYVREYLIEKYGEDVVQNGGLHVISTIDYKLQAKAEELTKKHALQNQKNFNASNAALVAVDPTTGQILVMVGSRDYFDKEIEGNFNVALANRQPGSAFKPFAYATAFKKGYTTETVLFDLPTEFNTNCDPQGNPRNSTAKCYMPQNYDLQYRGPMNLRNALAQSINIPAIKVLYLAGLRDTLQTAQDMGITSLKSADTYGLTLVLGGGEVSPLEMTSAYGIFANGGIRNAHTPILKVTDKQGKVLEEFTPDPKEVISEQVALTVTDVLSDNNARAPLFSTNSPAMFYDREVALKTGTTNDYKDVWILGYTPQIAVGAWAGNNNYTSMEKRTSGTIIVPLWRAFMDEALKELPNEPFKKPDPIDPNTRPILRGVWGGAQTVVIDRTTGQLATDQTLPENREERAMGGGEVHSILYWVNRNDPTGAPPSNPQADSQFENWETPVRAWAAAHGGSLPPGALISNPSGQNPGQNINPNGPEIPVVTIQHPSPNQTFARPDRIQITTSYQNKNPLKKAEFYINNTLIGTVINPPFNLSFTPQEVPGIKDSNSLKAILYDVFDNKGETQVQFNVRR